MGRNNIHGGPSTSLPNLGRYRSKVGDAPVGVAVYKIPTAENNIPYMWAFFFGVPGQTLAVARR